MGLRADHQNNFAVQVTASLLVLIIIYVGAAQGQTQLNRCLSRCGQGILTCSTNCTSHAQPTMQQMATCLGTCGATNVECIGECLAIPIPLLGGAPGEPPPSPSRTATPTADPPTPPPSPSRTSFAGMPPPSNPPTPPPSPRKNSYHVQGLSA